MHEWNTDGDRRKLYVTQLHLEWQVLDSGTDQILGSWGMTSLCADATLETEATMRVISFDTGALHLGIVSKCANGRKSSLQSRVL
jgi:hypothetical protein